MTASVTIPGTASVTIPGKASITIPGKVSVILVNYNGIAYLQACLESLAKTRYDDYEILLIDNDSADGSADYTESHFPDARTIRTGANLGFGGANNLGARCANGEYLAFLNVDTTVEPGWLKPLVETLAHDHTIGLTTAKLLTMSEPDRINTCGNEVHFTGYGFLRGWMQPANTLNEPAEVPSISGAAFVIPACLFHQLGGFDEGFYPAYVEDTDLSWRARLAGYHICYVPESIVYHDYRARFGPEKYAMLERNRHQLLLKNLRWRSLLLLLPALLLSETISWGFALLKGFRYARAKLSGYSWIARHWLVIMGTRRETQKLRRVSDRQILTLCSYRLAYGQTGDSFAAKIAQKIADPLFFWLRRASLAVMRW